MDDEFPEGILRGEIREDHNNKLWPQEGNIIDHIKKIYESYDFSVIEGVLDFYKFMKLQRDSIDTIEKDYTSVLLIKIIIYPKIKPLNQPNEHIGTIDASISYDNSKRVYTLFISNIKSNKDKINIAQHKGVVTRILDIILIKARLLSLVVIMHALPGIEILNGRNHKKLFNYYNGLGFKRGNIKYLNSKKKESPYAEYYTDLRDNKIFLPILGRILRINARPRSSSFREEGKEREEREGGSRKTYRKGHRVTKRRKTQRR